MKKVILSLIFIFLFSLSIFAANSIVSVQVQGNTCTKKFVILNLMNYKKGMKVDIDKLAAAQTALESSGLFSNVYMSLKAASNDNYVLVVSVEEKNHVSPLFDLEKGIGVEESDLFGFGIKAKAFLRCFRFSPFELFLGGYSIGLSSRRAFGTPFSFELRHSELKKLPWTTPNSNFQYNLLRTTTGMGYMLNENAGIMIRYVYEDISTPTTTHFTVNALSLEIRVYPVQNENNRNYTWWELYVEHGMNNINYTVGTANVEFYHRIIGQIYFRSRLYGVLNYGNVPFTRKIYFGDTYNLKGYDTREFGAPLMLLSTLRIGMPLTSTFGISKSPELTTYTPELISQLAFVKRGNFGLESFKPSIGLGLKINTPFGNFEPEIFYGKKLELYLEMK